MSVHQEIAFEDAIERSMVASGWLRGEATHYRRDLALDTAELFAFIGATQAEQWNQLVEFEGGDPDAADTASARSPSGSVGRSNPAARSTSCGTASRIAGCCSGSPTSGPRTPSPMMRSSGSRRTGCRSPGSCATRPRPRTARSTSYCSSTGSRSPPRS